jgi:hypothetical protein
MYQVQQLTSDPSQQQNLILADGTILSMSLYFSQQQAGWFCSLSYGSSFVLNGFRIVVSPNILRQWQNVVPFGLSCFSPSGVGREPSQQQDFSSGAFQLTILTEEEVVEYETFLQGGS